MALLRRAAAVFGLAAWACTAGAEPLVFVSEDGQRRVERERAHDGGAAGVDGSGAGPGFSPRAGVPFPAQPNWTYVERRAVGAVRIGDLNNDQRQDLFVGCFTSAGSPPYPVYDNLVFYNTGSSTAPFAGPPSWRSADLVHTGDAQLGDINRDGFLDIVVICGGFAFSPPRIYFGTATGPATSPGWISAPPIAGWAVGGHLFDVDGDGDLDLFTANQGVSGTQPTDAWRANYLFFNNNGTLATAPGWQSADIGIQNTAASADFDNDGDLDIAVAKWVNFESAIYRNTGTTLETLPSWGVGSTGTDRGVAWADIDNDSDPDLAVGINQDNTRFWRNTLGTLSQSGAATAPTFYGAQEIAFADVDRDGDLDLGEIHFGDGKCHIYLNPGNGQFPGTPSWTFDAPETAGNAIAFGDVNGDGWVDLALGYSGDNSVRVFLAIPQPRCDSIDFNRDGVFPDLTDIVDFFFVYGGGACPTPQPTGCNDLDFNNDAVFPDLADVVKFLDVFGGGSC